MKLRQISFKIISMVMVFAMMFSISATTISAIADSIDNHDHENESEKIYTSLGDSMTNGYGLPGYDGNTGVEDYGDGSYANQFAEAIGATEHYRLAMSAMRAEDLHWLLEVDYNDPAVIELLETLNSKSADYYKANPDEFNELWYSVFTNGDFWTWRELVHDYRFDVAAYCIEGKDQGKKFYTGDAYKAYNDVQALQIVAEYYQNAVKTSDVISLGMGNGNFGVFMFGRITNAIGFTGSPEDDLAYQVENAIIELEPEMQAKVLGLKDELFAIVEDYLGENITDSVVLHALANAVVYTGVSYVLNYAGSVEAILQHNPDAEIVLVALMNTFASNKEVEGVTMGALLEAIFVPLNIFIAALPTYMKATNNGVYADATFYYAEAADVECIVDTYAQGLNDLVRSRFVESIVGTKKNPGTVWALMGNTDYITLEDVVAYEKLSGVEKLAFATVSDDNAKKVVAISTYLAFEKAVIESVNYGSVSVNAVLGLGSFNLDMKTIEDGLAEVVAEMQAANHVKVNGEFVEDDYIRPAANYVDAALTAQLNAGLADFAVLGLPADYTQVDIYTLAGALNTAVQHGYATPDQAAQLMGVYVFKTTVSGVRSAVRYPGTAKLKMTNAFLSLGYSDVEAKGFADQIYDTVYENYMLAYTGLATPEALSEVLLSNEALAGLLGLFARCVIGNGIGSHPSQKGHDTLYEAVMFSYETGYTAQDETIKNLIIAGNALVDYIKENYDEMYADAYAELKEAGYIDAAQAGVAQAIEAVKSAIEKLEGVEVDADLADAKEQLLNELNLTVVTLINIQKILGSENLNWKDYETLVNLLAKHADNIAKLTVELATVAADRANVALQEAIEVLEILVSGVLADVEAELKVLIEELYNLVNFYLTETLPEEYKAFVNALVAALGYYSAEAADFAYNWLLNNPVTVIEFFVEYGDDIVRFLATDGKVIFAVLGFIAQNYGEDILYFVLDNADVILPAVAEWFSIHGENTWELIVVYFDAIVTYFDLGIELDFSSLENITASFNKIFALLGDLIDLIAQGAYDFLDALNILEEIEAELAKLNAYLESLVRGAIDGVNSFIESKIAALNKLFGDQIAALEAYLAEQIAALKAEAWAQIEALKAQAWAQIEALKAQAEKQIAMVKAEIEAQIAALKAQLENAVGELKAEIEAEIARLEALLAATIAEINAKLEAAIADINAKLEAAIAEINANLEAAIAALKAEIQAQIDALKAELEALLNAEINNAEDAIAALNELLKRGVISLGEYIYASITAFVADAVEGKFTPNEDTYYVSINGGSADYADLLADALSSNLDNSIALDKMTWSDLDYDKLALADLITIGFDENEISGFAIDQMLAYVKNYADVTLRNNTNEYIDGVFVRLEEYFNEIKEAMGDFGILVPDIDLETPKSDVDFMFNITIDILVSYDLIAEKELVEMDWAKYVGENNLSYVDAARANLKSQILNAGIMEYYTYTVDVVEYMYNNSEDLGLTEILQYIEEGALYDILGEYSYYNIDIPVADTLVFAAESYLYGNVAFQAEYGELIHKLYEINPEATIVLLGHYNAYNFELALGDVVINLAPAYSYVSGVASLQPFAYALLSENIAYVEIGEAETVFESYVKEGFLDNSILTFLMMYLSDTSITDVSAEGNVYIYEQILKYLTIGCEHKYDSNCDTDCNKCGEIREAADHVYDNNCDTDCNECGATRETEHVYDHACDTTCNECGEVRKPGKHEYDENGVCVNCGALRPAGHTHVFDGCHDTTCNECDFTRPAEEHEFNDDCDDVTCYKCSYVRERQYHSYNCDGQCVNCSKKLPVAPGHEYDHACDTTCNVCGATRTVSGHIYNLCTDTACSACGAAVAAKGHSFGEWQVIAKATNNSRGYEVHTCSMCGLREIKIIKALGGLSGGAIAGITVGSVVVAGAAGFAIYWFLIQKKTFAALVEAAKALVGSLTGSAAAPAAAAEATVAAEAAAPAAEAEASAVEAEAPAAEEETK